MSAEKELKKTEKVKVQYLTYSRLNKEMKWVCSNSFDDLGIAEKYLKLELKDLHKVKDHGGIELPPEKIEIEGRIVKNTITTVSEFELQDRT